MGKQFAFFLKWRPFHILRLLRYSPKRNQYQHRLHREQPSTNTFTFEVRGLGKFSAQRVYFHEGGSYDSEKDEWLGFGKRKETWQIQWIVWTSNDFFHTDIIKNEFHQNHQEWICTLIWKLINMYKLFTMADSQRPRLLIFFVIFEMSLFKVGYQCLYNLFDYLLRQITCKLANEVRWGMFSVTCLQALQWRFARNARNIF